MANFGKYTRRKFESLLEYDIMLAREGCEHPERASESYCDAYFSDFDGVGSMRYWFGSGDDNRDNFASVISARIDERLQELGQVPLNRNDVKYAVSLACTLPRQVPPQDEKKFFDSFQVFCEDYFGKDNMYCYAVHFHENRPHAQVYAMPVVNGRMDNKHWHNRMRYQEFHGRLQSYMDQAMGYHIEIELDDDNPEKKKNNVSVNTLKDKTNKVKIKELQERIKGLESERNYFRRELVNKESVYNYIRRTNPDVLRKAGKEMSDSDKVDESVLNARYEMYHSQRVEAGRKNRSKER